MSGLIISANKTFVFVANRRGRPRSPDPSGKQPKTIANRSVTQLFLTLRCASAAVAANGGFTLTQSDVARSLAVYRQQQHSSLHVVIGLKTQHGRD
jgi:hypothetical protein